MIEPLVAHHPARHPYIENLWPGRAPWGEDRRFWDGAALAAAGVDVAHVHFGFEHLGVDELTAWIASLRRHGIGLVHTAHDLDNPHLVDQRSFHRRVGLLVEAASAVVTLSPSAAETIERRYGRCAVVLDHPNIVPPGRPHPLALGEGTRCGIYVHAATCRPNFDLALVERIASCAQPVTVHVRPSAPAAALGQLRALARATPLRLDLRPRLSDDELFSRLAAAALVALPYRWGTHSGLLEAAHDLGTPVLAPAFGGFGDQGAVTFDSCDELPEVIERATRTATGITPERRAAQRRRSRAVYGTMHDAARRVGGRVPAAS